MKTWNEIFYCLAIPDLYEISEEVKREELEELRFVLRICLIVSEVSDEIMGLDGQLRHHRLGYRSG